MPHLEELLFTDQVIEFHDLKILAAALPNLLLLGVKSARCGESVQRDSTQDNIPEAHDQPMNVRARYFYDGRPLDLPPNLSRFISVSL